MVHINSKYVNDDGTLDPGYATNCDGVAVLGFMFKVKKSEVNQVLSFSSQGSGGQLDVSEPNQLSHLVEKETVCSRQLIKAFDPNLQVHSMKMDMLTRTKVRIFLKLE